MDHRAELPPSAGAAVRLPIHHRTPTSPARDRQPTGHRPSHIGCTHSFRTNGGYTDARIDRLRTAATRRMGAATTSRSVRRSGSVGRVRSLRTAMIGPAAAQASAQSPPGPSGACKHPPLTSPALAAACCSARQQAATRIRSASAIAQSRASGSRGADDRARGAPLCAGAIALATTRSLSGARSGRYSPAVG
jgi:hypothetical protein